MMFYLLSVRAPEDEDPLLFDRINRRVAHISRLNANTTTIQSEPMLVRIVKTLKRLQFALSNIGIGSFEFVIRI